jgi:serine protease Do
MERLKRILKVNVVAVAAASAAALLLWQAVPAPPAQAARAEALPISTPASFADVIEAVQPAVVNISSAAPAGSGVLPRSPSMEEFFRRFFGGQSAPAPQGAQPEVRSMGSGFIVEAQGLVVTNNHVIDGAHEILVTLNSGDQYPAEVVGRDPKTDLALLKIQVDQDLPFATFGDSDSTRTGDWVIAIGNPFGLGGTATTGIVSARGRDIRSGPFDDFLQIDAPINRGNSGGPLFDIQGRVIGVNTAIYSPTEAMWESVSPYLPPRRCPSSSSSKTPALWSGDGSGCRSRRWTTTWPRPWVWLRLEGHWWPVWWATARQTRVDWSLVT